MRRETSGRVVMSLIFPGLFRVCPTPVWERCYSSPRPTTAQALHGRPPTCGRSCAGSPRLQPDTLFVADAATHATRQGRKVVAFSTPSPPVGAGGFACAHAICVCHSSLSVTKAWPFADASLCGVCMRGSVFQTRHPAPCDRALQRQCICAIRSDAYACFAKNLKFSPFGLCGAPRGGIMGSIPKKISRNHKKLFQNFTVFCRFQGFPNGMALERTLVGSWALQKQNLKRLRRPIVALSVS